MHWDIAQAFDSITHQQIYRRLRKYQYDDEIINTIRWLYEQTKLRIENEEISIKIGVIQGGLLSPKLFNIVYDSLIERLIENNIFVNAYADDIVLAL